MDVYLHFYCQPTRWGEDNVFTCVCHYVHNRGWVRVSLVPCPFRGVGYFWSHVPSRVVYPGVEYPGGRLSGFGYSGRGRVSGGGSVSRQG